MELCPKALSITVFECDFCNEQRNSLFQNLNPNINANFSVLTSGSQNRDIGTNKAIIQAGLKCIKDTHRFE